MNDPSASSLGGQWAVAIMMIVIVSWLLYRLLAPKSFKEWRKAGLVQAFVIALYAEMYGFPLTVYLLSRYLHLDIPWLHIRGHLWATLLGYGAIGALIEMLLGYGFIIVGLLLLAQGWRQIYEANKDGAIVTGGLYQYMRHPQYTGIFLALFGQLIHWPTIPTLILFPVICWVYVRLAVNEERRMLQRFEDGYRSYMEAVPRFFPRKEQWRAMINEM